MSRPRRLGLLGDVHAADRRLADALLRLGALGVDAVLCVGDVVDGEGDVDRCVLRLRAAGALTVRGNRDRWLLDGTMRDLTGATRRETLGPATLEFLAALPRTLEVDTAGGRLLLCHGVGANDMRRLVPEDEGYALEANEELQTLLRQREHAFLVGGHTHRRMDRAFGRLRAINPGALAATEQPGFAVLDACEGTVEFHDLG